MIFKAILAKTNNNDKPNLKPNSKNSMQDLNIYLKLLVKSAK